MKNNTFRQMAQAIDLFLKERDWGKTRTPKDMAMDLSIEANEALECLLWLPENEPLPKGRKQDLALELADVLHALVKLADYFDIELDEVFYRKLEILSKRYPPEEVAGQHTYDFKKQKGLKT